VNLGALVVITVIGFGLTSSAVTWLGWQGYIFRLIGLDSASEFAATDIGVLVALVLGLLTPIAFGISMIRRQEAAQTD
jgi:hypothetical protein